MRYEITRIRVGFIEYIEGEANERHAENGIVFRRREIGNGIGRSKLLEAGVSVKGDDDGKSAS